MESRNKLNHIMLVDDEEDICAIAAMSLKEFGGYIVTTCQSGKAAIHMLQHAPSKPDLMLLDVMMPGMTGLELLEKIKKMQYLSDIPVIFMTARAHASHIEEYMSLGVIGVIPKPFDAIKLESDVKRLWNKHMQGFA